MAIKKGDIIKVEYEGTFEDGTIFDSTDKNNGIPLKFEVGAGHLIKGFDEAVLGKEVGNEFQIKLQPSEAYGDYNKDLLRKMPKDLFPKEQDPEPGMIIQIMNDEGHVMLAAIHEVKDEEVIIDLNHPLAGKVLNFKIKVVETGCEPDPPHECGCGCGHNH
ncbi:MAG: peptidylprolyl isomerase [Candidatus Hermodarchaeota archaeon]